MILNRNPTDLDFYNFRDHIADDIRRGHIKTDPASIFLHAETCAGVDPATAGEWAELFLTCLNHHVSMKMPQALAKSTTSTLPTSLGDEAGDAGYLRFRNEFVGDIRCGRVELDLESLATHIRDHARVDYSTAVKWVERFCDDLVRDVEGSVSYGR